MGDGTIQWKEKWNQSRKYIEYEQRQTNIKALQLLMFAVSFLLICRLIYFGMEVVFNHSFEVYVRHV